MSLLPPLPLRSPFLDPRTGLVAQPWSSFLQALMQRLGDAGHVTDLGTVSSTTTATATTVAGLPATNAPPGVAAASALGAVTARLAREDHTHQGVTLGTAQTVSGAKTFSATVIASGAVLIAGTLTASGALTVGSTLTHSGTTAGFLGATPAAQQAALAALTDNTGATPNTTIENVPACTGDGGGVATVSAAADVATVASVNTALVAVENDIADLTARVNALAAVLRTFGFVAP